MGWTFGFGKKASANKQTVANNTLRDSLKSHGDNGAAVRHVIHFAYPLDDTANISDRSTIVADLQSQGYEAREAETNNGVVSEHYRSVTGREFDDLTSSLQTWFSERGWDYDGWECAIVKTTR